MHNICNTYNMYTKNKMDDFIICYKIKIIFNAQNTRLYYNFTIMQYRDEHLSSKISRRAL